MLRLFIFKSSRPRLLHIFSYNFNFILSYVRAIALAIMCRSYWNWKDTDHSWQVAQEHALKHCDWILHLFCQNFSQSDTRFDRLQTWQTVRCFLLNLFSSNLSRINQTVFSIISESYYLNLQKFFKSFKFFSSFEERRQKLNADFFGAEALL